MSRYRFELAGPADDADLRHVLANTPMPGRIALTFGREPSYFAAPGIDGFERQMVACRDTASGRIIGFGLRSLRKLYVNGTPTTIGYLSSIRLLAEHRNQGLVARGYRFFRELHADRQTPLYLTTIAETNEPAMRILASGRAGLPTYHPAELYHTAAIPIRASKAASGLQIEAANESDVARVFDFLQTWGPRRQFFPCYGASDLQDGGALHGLKASDILLARREGEIVGVFAGWDQQQFRQTVVHSYQGLLRWMRPVYNGWARLSGGVGLPRAGEPLRYLTGSLPIIANDDPAVFDALLSTMLIRADASRFDYLAVGMAEGDPLLPVVRKLNATWYTTRIFHACFADGERMRRSLDGRPTYLELGAL